MKKLNLVSVTIIMIALLTSFSMLTYAQPGHRGHHGEGKIQDLTEAQEKQIEEIKTAQKQEMLSTHNELKIKEAELTALQTADKVNMADVEAKIREISSLHEKLRINRANSHNDVRNILTDKQRVEFDIHHAKRPAGHHPGMRGKHGHHKKQGYKSDGKCEQKCYKNIEK